MKDARLTRKLNRFENAAISKAEKGCKEPCSWKEIDEEYDKAKKDLLAYIESIDGREWERQNEEANKFLCGGEE